MSITPTIDNVSNYLVPASGTTHAVKVEGVFSATPEFIDWRQWKIDNFPFQPQGVFIDNTAGTADIVITIQPINYTVSCPAGITKQSQFPAPNGQTCTITGAGQASVVFVDFPVLPESGLVSIGNTVSVALVSENLTNPLPTAPSINAGGGLPYHVSIVPATTQAMQASITGAALSATLTPAVQNTRLTKLIIALSANSTLAVAGENLITVKQNNIVIYSESAYIPSALSGTWESSFPHYLDGELLNIPTGGGSLVVSVATALATGTLSINAYFGA